MINSSKNEIITSLKHDEARRLAIEARPVDVQAQYAYGIGKLQQRIFEERAAVGLLPHDTEAWAKHLLDDFDYYVFPARVSDHINHLLARVEDARLAADLENMINLQRQLEQYVHDLQKPQQLSFGA